MKKFLSLFAIISLFLSSTAHPVDMESAKVIAAKFMETNDLQHVTTYQTDNNIAAFYVFNTTDGFIIVSADDCETPIIGYSYEGQFDPNNVPIQMQDYLLDFVARIQYGIENHVVVDTVTARQWDLVKASGKLNESKSATTVPALLTSKWHQGCLYNNLCPIMSGPCGRAEVGCVAVAMGQIMHYWRYPNTGWGTHSYNNSGQTLSADFGNTTYDWEHMPDSLTENASEAEIEAVAILLYHCGVSVDMRFTNNGSLANSADVPSALVHYFDYARCIQKEKKSNYDNEEWVSMLKSNLDQQKPILYSGISTGNIGHAFVCDGYDDNDLFHFNWGWGTADGYFALSNLNPLGFEFNSNHSAILNIIPQYEPCVVFASVYPSNAGTVEGTGEYHIGAQCTLTAVPAENTKFEYWMKQGRVVSKTESYTFSVTDDIDDIIAIFSYLPIEQISACYYPEENNPGSTSINVSWNYKDLQWALLKEFYVEKNLQYGYTYLTTDNEHIYFGYPLLTNPPTTFEKYTMDGELVEQFDISGTNPNGLTCDGNYFYCSNNDEFFNVFHLYCLDFANKTVVDSLYVGRQFTLCSYDAENDGFWLYNAFQGKNMTLINRQGEAIKTTPSLSSYSSVVGFGSLTAKDGTPHLLIISSSDEVIDYDVSTNILKNHPRLNMPHGSVKAASVGKYDGKDAMFVVAKYYDTNHASVLIYEIESHLEQIISYRIYRTNSVSDTIMLADEITGSFYLDSTWNDIPVGLYRFGISSVFANGAESEIIWSEPVEKTNIGINEVIVDPENSSVQKVFENGQIVIIKDGKRYTVTGQKLN